jgi:hypothetical protein
MKTHYEIEYYCEWRREWRNFDGCCLSKNKGINQINKYRKDPQKNCHRLRLVEITKQVIKAWPIQQLLPYCTGNEDKDTLRNSDLL